MIIELQSRAIKVALVPERDINSQMSKGVYDSDLIKASEALKMLQIDTG
jgi:hypothetical protein